MTERSVVVWIPQRKDAQGGLEAWITTKDKDTFVGDGYVYYLDYGDGFISVYLSQKCLNCKLHV